MEKKHHPLFNELQKALAEARKGDERSKFAAEEIEQRLTELGYETASFSQDLASFSQDLADELHSAKERWAMERKGKAAPAAWRGVK